MGDGSRDPGAMTLRASMVLQRLPLPLQEVAYWAIRRLAIFALLIIVLPLLVVVFILATLIAALLLGVLGPSPGPVGIVLAFAWLASWTVLPVVITVRIWRAFPLLLQLRQMAFEAPGPTHSTAVPDRPTTDPTADPDTLDSRIRSADARLGAPATIANPTHPRRR
jgi:hypothetical protein